MSAKDYETFDLGNGVVSATPAAVMARLAALPEDMSWTELRESIIPLLPRMRAMPAAAGAPASTQISGITVTFGVDIGPAFLVVGESLQADWGVTTVQLAAAGLQTASRRLAVMQPEDVRTDVMDDYPIRTIQTGQSIASTLLLFPSEVKRLFGDDPLRLVAPMRDLLIAFDVSVPLEMVAWVNDEFRYMDPNGLALGVFDFDPDALTIVELGA
jgi:hypothetical protein